MADNSIPKEQFLDAYNNAPDTVREAFNSAETFSVVEDIRTHYNLHVDVAGNVGKMVGYMLLGLVSPAEFLGQMMFAGVDENVARRVLETLNTRIFVPLQNRIKNPDLQKVTSNAVSYAESEAVHSSHKTVADVMPPPSIIPVTQKIVPVVEVQKEEVPEFNLVRPDALVAAPVTSNPVQVPENLPGTMPSVPNSDHITPARSFQTASVPYTSIPTASQPIQKPPIRESIPTITPVTAEETIVRTSQPVTPIKKEYAADPYRETIDK